MAKATAKKEAGKEMKVEADGMEATTREKILMAKEKNKATAIPKPARKRKPWKRPAKSTAIEATPKVRKPWKPKEKAPEVPEVFKACTTCRNHLFCKPYRDIQTDIANFNYIAMNPGGVWGIVVKAMGENCTEFKAQS